MTGIATGPRLGSKADRLFLMALELARTTPEFFLTKGPGKGDRASNLFMSQLREMARNSFGADFSEHACTTTAGFRFDFYFFDEECAVEVAFGIDKPNSEFERDIFKCLLAMEEGCKIKRLLFICKPGGLTKFDAPGPSAIRGYVARKHHLEVDVLEIQPPQSSA